MFKVGDIITGIKGNSYGITNENAIMEVVETTHSLMRVKIISTTTHSRIGEYFTVNNNSSEFKLVPNDSIKKEEKKVEKVYSGLPKRVVFQYSESTKKGATILFWSDNKEDKTVVKLADGDKFDKETGFLWGWYMHTSKRSRTKVNTMLSFVKKASVKKYLKFQFKEITGMNITEIDTYLDKMCK